PIHRPIGDGCDARWIATPRRSPRRMPRRDRTAVDRSRVSGRPRASRSDQLHRGARDWIVHSVGTVDPSRRLEIRLALPGGSRVGGAQHMTKHLDRREFIQLAGLTTAGIAGVVFSSGLRGVSLAAEKERSGEDFMFLQMSDLHWGFTGPAVNPDATGTLDKAIAHVNALPHQPDFIVFTGDLTPTTDDPPERRARLAHVRDAVRKLTVKTQRYLAGEHDASLDQGEAFKEFFGQTHYTFDHKGVHFIVLDNVSDPKGMLGDEQIQWLRADLGKLDKE